MTSRVLAEVLAQDSELAHLVIQKEDKLLSAASKY